MTRVTAEALRHRFEEERRRAVETCTRCGACVSVCPAVKLVGPLRNRPAGEIQGRLVDFLAGGPADRIVRDRAISCLQCWGCSQGVCPVGLDPLALNEIAKGDLARSGAVETRPWNPGAPGFDNRVLAAMQSTRAEYSRITTPGPRGRADVVFFAGCNVYRQPDKLLTALDVLDLLGVTYAFLPGLEACCGNGHLASGDVDGACEAGSRLVEELAARSPARVVTWCLNCALRLQRTLAPDGGLPFEVMTLARFLGEQAGRLPVATPLRGRVTLHEVCKAAWTGIDPGGPRRVLEALGLRIVEMPRHGREAVCCGAGFADGYPACFEELRSSRLREAGATGAGVMVDVCHACHEAFVPGAARHRVEPVNWMTLVGRALGIHREDRLGTWLRWGSVERALDDAAPFLEGAPFSRDTAAAVLARLLGGGGDG